MAFVTPVVILLKLVLCVFLISVNGQAQTNHSNIIKLGSSLSPNFTCTTNDLLKNISSSSCWFSPSGLFAFGFYPHRDGFAVGTWMVNQTETTIVWTANRYDPPLSSNTTLELTEKGLLLRTNVTTSDGDHNNVTSKFLVAVPSDDGVDKIGTSSAALLDSGNFVVYGGKNSSDDDSIVWQSFDFPTDTILVGQNLSAGDELVSSVSKTDHSSGIFFLSMQGGGIGNLVLYPVNSSNTSEDAYWVPDTASHFYDNLSLNCTGSLFLGDSYSDQYMVLANGSSSSSYSPADNREKSSSIIYRATLDADGILRTYSHHYKFLMKSITSSVSVEWSALDNQCEVKGFCGFNSFCELKGKKADCYCYPGFAFVNPKSKSLGCYRNFTSDSCKTENNNVNPRTRSYNITSLEKMRWVDNPYSEVPMKKEACSKSCLAECDCWAVLHTSGKCQKFNLPLRYGKIDPTISSTAFFKVERLGNNGNQGPATKPETVTQSRNSQILIVLGSSLGSIAFLCSCLAISSLILYKQRVLRYNKLLKENVNLGSAQDFGLQAFSYSELEEATEGFKEELGRGLFGAVYKGALSNGGNIRAIAVKRLENFVEEGIREFRAEISTIGRTHHRNLVQLLGFCIEGSQRLLVYEFMSNGSLADLLFKATTRPLWKDRVRFILEVAKGMLYLHEECWVHIIHCNLKPQNVLLDDNWTARISDFGFARLLLTPSQYKMSGESVEGKTGYSAPECQKNALISVKADVYSFGIVLLEIICCRRNIDLKVSNNEEIALSSWAYNCFVAGELNKLVEGDQNVDAKRLERMVKVGLWCIQDDPDLRPSMKSVILMLEGTMDVPPLPSNFATV
ncbi:S-receptor-like serine/threonine-protein kinase [Trema orientale]|uniref:Receptor-like serine/threonine-protein kinase n=1 Tax=Trema orientale TaxID=63057 RepID=A0A2P5B3Y8_TREOI|nr:S-receptor-like serine/threonine-protein kinase [Trema orientale]